MHQCAANAEVEWHLSNVAGHLIHHRIVNAARWCCVLWCVWYWRLSRVGTMDHFRVCVCVVVCCLVYYGGAGVSSQTQSRSLRGSRAPSFSSQGLSNRRQIAQAASDSGGGLWSVWSPAGPATRRITDATEEATAEHAAWRLVYQAPSTQTRLKRRQRPQSRRSMKKMHARCSVFLFLFCLRLYSFLLFTQHEHKRAKGRSLVEAKWKLEGATGIQRIGFGNPLWKNNSKGFSIVFERGYPVASKLARG